jgi:hypothetical protein
VSAYKSVFLHRWKSETNRNGSLETALLQSTGPHLGCCPLKAGQSLRPCLPSRPLLCLKLRVRPLLNSAAGARSPQRLNPGDTSPTVPRRLKAQRAMGRPPSAFTMCHSTALPRRLCPQSLSQICGHLGIPGSESLAHRSPHDDITPKWEHLVHRGN